MLWCAIRKLTVKHEEIGNWQDALQCTVSLYTPMGMYRFLTALAASN